MGSNSALRAFLACVILCVCLPNAALAQGLNFNFFQDATLSQSSVQLILLITVLSLAPGILVTVTCFPFVVTIFSILRQAIGLQQSPPNMLLVSLSLFLTYFVMEPVAEQAWSEGLQPYFDGAIELGVAVDRTLVPFQSFMAGRTDPDTYTQLAMLRPDEATALAADSPFSILTPAFILSELSRAFQIGFLIYLPFLIIDLVVAAVLMSMGMMMVPPVIVSLPFKLAFFVVSDGWVLLSTALVSSYL